MNRSKSNRPVDRNHRRSIEHAWVSVFGVVGGVPNAAPLARFCRVAVCLSIADDNAQTDASEGCVSLHAPPVDRDACPDRTSFIPLPRGRVQTGGDMSEEDSSEWEEWAEESTVSYSSSGSGSDSDGDSSWRDDDEGEEDDEDSAGSSDVVELELEDESEEEEESEEEDAAGGAGIRGPWGGRPSTYRGT